MSNGVWFSISVWNMDTLHRGFCFLLMLWGCVNLSTSVDVISVDGELTYYYKIFQKYILQIKTKSNGDELWGNNYQCKITSFK